MFVKKLIPQVYKQALRRELLLKGRVLVGTHHKTGTVWMQSVLGDIARHFGVRLEGRRLGEVPPERFDIYFNTHSDFDLASMRFPFKGLHVVRDPRDLIVSATHYHLVSDEAWLHARRPEFGHMSYHEKINSFQSFDDQMLFEMENSSYRNVSAMKVWDYGDARFMNVRYEDLMVDTQLQLFERIFRHLGFREWAIGWCLAFAYRNSLFSGGVRSQHVRSGATRQWPDYFRSRHRARFEQLFGDVLSRMGYDGSDDEAWQRLEDSRDSDALP